MLKLSPCVVILAGKLGFAASGLAQTARPPTPERTVKAAELSGPRIEFASPVFNFGKISQGEVVRHEFVFRNTGTTALEIANVTPGCGCTTAGSWDRRVEPGGTGIIPLQFNSASFSGEVAKTATVACNDVSRSNVVLQIKGMVWRPFEVTPAMAVFLVSSETETDETKVVRILSHLEESVTLSGVESTDRSFRTNLTVLKPGKEFELHITAVPPFAPPSLRATFTVQTSSSAAPTIKIIAQLMVQQPVTVLPNQITLPAGLRSAAISSAVTIHNYWPNALVLSSASVNVPGAEVRVQEIQTNRMFQLIVQFPAGFELKPEDNVEVSVRTNHPKFHVIRVPVVAAQSSGSSTGATGVKSPALVGLIPAVAPVEEISKE